MGHYDTLNHSRISRRCSASLFSRDNYYQVSMIAKCLSQSLHRPIGKLCFYDTRFLRIGELLEPRLELDVSEPKRLHLRSDITLACGISLCTNPQIYVKIVYVIFANQTRDLCSKSQANLTGRLLSQLRITITQTAHGHNTRLQCTCITVYIYPHRKRVLWLQT